MPKGHLRKGTKECPWTMVVKNIIENLGDNISSRVMGLKSGSNNMRAQEEESGHTSLLGIVQMTESRAILTVIFQGDSCLEALHSISHLLYLS